MRTNISSNTKWENIVGYSRAVRIGNIIEVSGTTAIDEKGNIIGPNDYYLQTKYIFEKIQKALEQAGGKLSDVIRTRMYVKDILYWQEVAKAHNEFFNTIKPATSMVEVSSLIDDDLLVEIEASAVVEAI